MALSEFYLIELPLLLVLRETCFKAMRIQLDNYFLTVEILIFAIFAQKVNFERSQFLRMGMALSEFYLLLC